MNPSTTVAKPYLLNFVFEQIDPGKENLIQCPDILRSGATRFHPCILADTTLKYDLYEKRKTEIVLSEQIFRVEDAPQQYVIASGVRHHPVDWTEPNGGTSLFHWLSPKYLKDLQEGRAVLLLDQCLEGYHVPWLWNWFHAQFSKYNIPPAGVIYATGDLTVESSYDNWCTSNNIKDRMKTIPFPHFENHVQWIAEGLDLTISFDKELKYKKTHVIKTFNCLQKRPRPHRSWFFLELYKAGLLESGLVSTNTFEYVSIEGQQPDPVVLQEARSMLPLLIDDTPNNVLDDSFYINRIRHDICQDTWISVVSEPIFLDSDQSVFISEKTFKPIACMHPFIILGGKGSLSKLRDMGYKTFGDFINEDYDELPTFDRMQAIIRVLKHIDSIENKISWYESMRPILEHNYNLFHAKKKVRPPASKELIMYCKEYFNVH